MSLTSAYLLISHGSRDPRPHLAMEELAGLVRAKLEAQVADWTLTAGNRTLSSQANHFLQRYEVDRGAGGVLAKQEAIASLRVSSAWYPLVGTAVLELAPLPLHKQICEFASQALAVGCNQIQLLPLFLLPGVHVMEDIPREVALAQASLGQAVALNQRSYLGAHPGLARMLASQLTMLNADVKILLSHGSRRAGSKEAVQSVADQLGAVVAYWSVKPTLEEQLQAIAGDEPKQIAILPYFLFSGGITDAIAQRTTSLQEQFPKLGLTLAQPMGASPELANLIVDLI